MGVVATPAAVPGGGVPDAVMIERLRKGMAGCGSCLGLGDYDPYTGTWMESTPTVPSTPSTGGGGSYWSGGGFLQDITRGSVSILSSILTPPAYRQSGPGTLTEIRVPGGGASYPGGQGPTSLPVSGVGMNTVLLFGVGVLALFVIQSRGR